MLILFIWPKCTLAASHAAPRESHADGTDRQTGVGTEYGLEMCGNRFFVSIPSHFNDFIPISL